MAVTIIGFGVWLGLHWVRLYVQYLNCILKVDTLSWFLFSKASSRVVTKYA
jgi:hypothetical protein